MYKCKIYKVQSKRNNESQYITKQYCPYIERERHMTSDVKTHDNPKKHIESVNCP